MCISVFVCKDEESVTLGILFSGREGDMDWYGCV